MGGVGGGFGCWFGVGAWVVVWVLGGGGVGGMGGLGGGMGVGGSEEVRRVLVEWAEREAAQGGEGVDEK